MNPAGAITQRDGDQTVICGDAFDLSVLYGPYMPFNSGYLPALKIRPERSVAKGPRRSIPTRVPAISTNLDRQHARPNLTGDNIRDYGSCRASAQLTSMDFATAEANYRKAADRGIVLVDEAA
jgi:hypothetical protein